MKLSTGMITGLIVSIVLITVLLNVARTTIPIAATAFHNLTDSQAAATGVYGTNAASLAGNFDDYAGYFWVLGPFVLVIGVAMALFLRK